MTRSNRYQNLDKGLKYLLIAGSTIALIVSGGPWIKVVSPFVGQSVVGFPPIAMVSDWLSALIPFGLGAYFAGLWLLVWDHVGAWGTVALYLLINAYEVGLIGNRKQQAAAYIVDLTVCLICIPIYGDGYQMLFLDAVKMRLSPSLFNIRECVNLALTVFAVDGIWGGIWGLFGDDDEPRQPARRRQQPQAQQPQAQQPAAAVPQTVNGGRPING